MSPWGKTCSFVVAAVCATSLTSGSSNAFAEDAASIDESTETAVDELNSVDRPPNRRNDIPPRYDNDDPPNDNDNPPYDNDDDRIDGRHGYGGCYSYCDDQRNDCMRRYYRGYDDWHRGDRRRWDRRRHWDDGYRRCERRFDYCIQVCRESRWRNR